MKIAIEGCAHGELEIIYDTLKLLEERESIKIDLLICCGDFQSTRNEHDLHCMAIPPKYHNMCSFYKYYNGEKEAPILTIFIGGNHEASNYLQELPYGGWVAPNIYYLGYAGVVDVAGVRIGGVSGIYKNHDYFRGHYEKPPYDNDTKRSVYHIRSLEVYRLKQITSTVDIFMSHDWPTGIWEFGDVQQLLRFKPFFKNDIERGCLGSKPCEELLNYLQPKYWFSAHLHCKFSALVQHSKDKMTKFLALDKCLPKRRFLQVVDIEHDENCKIELSYDLEWLTVLNLTNHLLSIKGYNNFMPGVGSTERYEFTPTEEEKAKVFSKFSRNLIIPDNFEKTADGYDLENVQKHSRQPQPVINSQTTLLCEKLSIDDPLVLLNAFVQHKNSEEIDLPLEDDLETSSNTFIETPVKASLSLPAPKFENSNFELDTVGTEDESISETFNQSLVKTVEPVVDAEPSPVKKFKRRNASMYSNSDT